MLESNHQFERTDIPMIKHGNKSYREKVVIVDDVWIGRDVMMLGSKVIKNRTAIGVRCLLTKNFPEYSIVGGTSAILIRNRK